MGVDRAARPDLDPRYDAGAGDSADIVVKQVLTQDGRDLIAELVDAGADFLIVGGHALAVHGVSRATLDLDIFVRPTATNAARVLQALQAFGAPVRAHGVAPHDFEREGTIYQLGLPPNRIDVLTAIDGVTFDQASSDRVNVTVDGMVVPFLGLASLLTNKRAAARPKDLADVAALESLAGPRRS